MNGNTIFEMYREYSRDGGGGRGFLRGSDGGHFFSRPSDQMRFEDFSSPCIDYIEKYICGVPKIFGA